MKIILVLSFLVSLSSFAQTTDSCLYNLKIGDSCELGMDTMTPINIVLKNQKEVNELLTGRTLMELTVTKEVSQSDRYSDKEVFTFKAATCYGFMGNVCRNKAKLLIKRSYDKLLMDAVKYNYESSGVIEQ